MPKKKKKTGRLLHKNHFTVNLFYIFQSCSFISKKIENCRKINGFHMSFPMWWHNVVRALVSQFLPCYSVSLCWVKKVDQKWAMTIAITTTGVWTQLTRVVFCFAVFLFPLTVIFKNAWILHMFSDLSKLEQSLISLYFVFSAIVCLVFFLVFLFWFLWMLHLIEDQR